MNVVLGSPRGYCAGVARALDIVELCLERFGAPVYVRREIIHNPLVNEDLAQRGIRFIYDSDGERQIDEETCRAA